MPSGAKGLELNIHMSVIWGVWPLCHRSVSRWPEPALSQQHPCLVTLFVSFATSACFILLPYWDFMKADLHILALKHHSLLLPRADTESPHHSLGCFSWLIFLHVPTSCCAWSWIAFIFWCLLLHASRESPHLGMLPPRFLCKSHLP